MSKSRTVIRAKIISDCAALFNQRGYLHIGIPEIEMATGQTKAVLYGYFENRFALAKAVLEYNMMRQRGLIGQAAERQAQFRDKLMAHFDAYDPVMSNFPGGCPVFNAISENDDINVELRDIASRALQAWNEDISELILSGIRAGEFSPEQASSDLAWQLIGFISGAILAGQALQKPALTQQLLIQGKNTFRRLL